MNLLTKSESMRLKVDLATPTDKASVEYKTFIIFDKYTQYKLNINDYDPEKSTTLDSLTKCHNNISFTTYDVKNDLEPIAGNNVAVY